jgi:asparagine synthase (glutamine-hydrolysing)
MCGIAGIIAPFGSFRPETLSRMVRAISHRGPDDCGFEQLQGSGSDIWLGNTRLAILDLSPAGHQPMTDPESGNWIVYNGEVYNYREIREDLEGRGVYFQSGTDTEVLLKAYGEFGPDCVERFRGMFAFAIWDSRKQELFLCRDRAGEKPLYYCSPQPGVFLFASEIRAILASGLAARRLDPASVEIFLTNGFSVSPKTMVVGIQSMMPGHWFRVGPDATILERKCYWSLAKSKHPSNGHGMLSLMGRELSDSVRMRLISDVPLGAFLSGGLDSSTICALMKREESDVRTFSVSFQETDFDESKYSRWVARHFQTQHTEVVLGKADFFDVLPAALAGMDQPTFDGLNTFCVAQAARKSGLKVALSGAGSDELFGGYPFFGWVSRLAKTRPLVSLLPGPWSRSLSELFLKNSNHGLSGIMKAAQLLEERKGSADHYLIAAYQTTQTLFPSWVRRKLLLGRQPGNSQDIELGLPQEFLLSLRSEIQGEDPVSSISKIAYRLFLGERCLRDIDTMSMAVSLEVRAPFVDHVFVNSALDFPGKLRCRGVPDKPVLQRIVRPLLGDDYPWRRKQGFTFPFRYWLRDLPRWDYFHEVTKDEHLFEDVGLDIRPAQQLFDSFFQNRSGVPWSRIWAIVVLLAWCKQHRMSL